MVKKNRKWVFLFLPLSLVVVFWLYEVNLIAYADSSYRIPKSHLQPTRTYESGRTLNKGTIENVGFLNSSAKSAGTQTGNVKAQESNTDKKKDGKKTPAWMTILSAVGLFGASQALKKENPIPVIPKKEFKIMKVPRIITANVTKMIDKTVEVIKKVPYTVQETMQRTVDKVVDVTKKVAETVYETVKEKVVTPVRETYDKAVQKTKQITEYVTKQFEEVSKVARTVYDKVERTVNKIVPVVRNVTDYVTKKVEETYKYATQVTKNVTETIMQPVREAYQTVRQVPRQVTEYIQQKVHQTKQVARTVYDNIKRSRVWFENKVSTVWDEIKETKTRVVEKYENVRRWVGDKYRTVTEKFWGQTGSRVSYESVPVYGYVAQKSTSWIKRGWRWLKQTTTKWVKKITGWASRKIVQPIYGWVTRSYNQLVEAGHWVTDKVKKFVNETYTAIRRVPRQVTERVRHVSEWIEKVPRTVYDTVSEWVSKTVPVVKTVYDTVKETLYRTVQKPVQIVKQVAETVWNTGTRLVDKMVPVVRQVTDYVTEKVKEIAHVPRTIYDTVVNVVEKTVPVVKDIAYTAYEKAERIVDKVFEIAKQVPKTIYKEITEKVVQPTVETYQIAVEKFKNVKEYVTTKVLEDREVSRTVYDRVKFATLFTINPQIAMITLPQEVKKDIAIGSGKWALGIIEMLTNPQTYVNIETLGEDGIMLYGRILYGSLTGKHMDINFLREKWKLTTEELSLAERLIPSHWRGPIDPKWVEASNETQLATMLGLDVATLFVGLGELNVALKGAKVVNGANKVKKSEGVLNLIKNLSSKSKTAAPVKDISILKVPQGVSEAKFTEVSNILRNKVGHISDDIRIHGSRASGTATATSDLDIAIRVTTEQFDNLIKTSFQNANSGSAFERTMKHAVETGKINSRYVQLEGQKLSKVKDELAEILGKDVQTSIIKIGGQFDNGPWIPIK